MSTSYLISHYKIKTDALRLHLINTPSSCFCPLIPKQFKAHCLYSLAAKAKSKKNGFPFLLTVAVNRSLELTRYPMSRARSSHSCYCLVMVVYRGIYSILPIPTNTNDNLVRTKVTGLIVVVVISRISIFHFSVCYSVASIIGML